MRKFFLTKLLNLIARDLCTMESSVIMMKNDTLTMDSRFYKFRQSDLSLQDASRSGRPVSLDNDALKAAMNQNRFATVEELSEEVDSSSSTVHCHLQKLGIISKLG